MSEVRAGASFSEFAKKFSISPDGAKGGDIGYIRKGAVPVFDAAFNLHEGQMSGVLKSTYGFHIVRVLDRKGAVHLNYEQAKAKIVKQLVGERQQMVFNKWLEKTLKSAKIERNDSILEKIKIHTKGANE